MAQVKCDKCGKWYDDSNAHACGGLGGKEDLAKFREGGEAGTDGEL